MGRREIVATKASCQVFGHGFKLLYFGALIEQAGTVEPWVLAMRSRLDDRHVAQQDRPLKLSDLQFRTWAGRLINVLGAWYVGYGLVLMTGIA
jgi:hypothetical protein